MQKVTQFLYGPKRIKNSYSRDFTTTGKSTLLNFVLRANHGKRIAVIENEFSEGLGIESMIAKSGVDGENISDFFELPNGCVKSIYLCFHQFIMVKFLSLSSIRYVAQLKTTSLALWSNWSLIKTSLTIFLLKPPDLQILVL